ncbi:hypothetical protein [Mycolicibacterium goodii]|uniref:Lipoprotein LpqN n=1 Tax=Mycolicibacterium goodii TaxID=134601 RepID=A0ABS6HLY0_MYCGD|nr:hypothetical protein [Mycolicibacterium goodii]MBU8823714.1 hypothetical protein [Mycolicibacterium goodii]MBU8835886.1 hypothetical protein [Mycolicibacterium goodii]
MSRTTVTRFKLLLTTGLTAAAVATAAGCDGGQLASDPASGKAPALPVPAATSSSPKPQASDYSHLLLQAEDISIPPDTFTRRSTKVNPDGQDGASALFVNADDTRAIADTILIYPDVATASATLQQAVAAVNTMVEGGTPQPVPVGTGGTVISGMAPDGSKAVTLVMFTQGRALVRLEFDSAPDDPVTEQTVAAISRMQQIALRIGLPERE